MIRQKERGRPHRAIRLAQLDGNDALAASFAAHALALALVLKDSYPALMHEYAGLASRALYEAATGEAMPGADVRLMVRSV